ncbi:Uncharacterised protein [Legionella beliardensis]|uniref:Uncharacterized protein n=1 Tax=Legionella beliardensis TaxID=91822 RepID=A0A378HZ88_9GAMM|nr:hypothetical protein [Legionella beliardensis]STX27821.1 Uncharacterised protein [Legionella beliardensis]
MINKALTILLFLFTITAFSMPDAQIKHLAKRCNTLIKRLDNLTINENTHCALTLKIAADDTRFTRDKILQNDPWAASGKLYWAVRSLEKLDEAQCAYPKDIELVTTQLNIISIELMNIIQLSHTV